MLVMIIGFLIIFFSIYFGVIQYDMLTLEQKKSIKSNFLKYGKMVAISLLATILFVFTFVFFF